jgi:Zn-dependent protease with chaperone function
MRSTRRADRYWLGQVSLALSVLLLVSGLGIVRYSELARQFVAFCRRTFQGFATYGGAIMSLIPLALVALSFLLAGLSIWRQIRATRRLLQSLGTVRSLSPELVFLGRRLGIPGGRLRLVTDPRPLAFCVGFVRPTVWLTTGLVSALDREGLTAVLRHEGHHLRHRDPFKLLLVRVLADAFFFLPVVRELGRAYEVHKELAADAEAALDRAGRVGLAQALLKLLPQEDAVVEQAAVGSLLSGKRAGTTQARLEQLTHDALPEMRPCRRSLMVTGLALLVFFLVGLAPLTKPTHADWGESCGPEPATPAILWLDTL